VVINGIVDEHLEVETINELEEIDSNRRFDISKIDFDLLRREFGRRRDKNLVMKDIQEVLQERIAQTRETIRRRTVQILPTYGHSTFTTRNTGNKKRYAKTDP
jgi:nitrogen regulatory protein PII-like uncharacterized protein